MMNKKMDKALHIDTSGIVQYYSDIHHNRYEPTDYRVLVRLKDYIDEKTILLDYGCGKGRVDFFFRKFCGAKCIGIEYNQQVYEQALNNLKTSKLDGIEFVLGDASKYEVGNDVNCFYFFNPFSIQIFQKVMNQILISYYEKTRKIQIILYYASEEYISYLFSLELLKLVQEIDVNDIFSSNNDKERILLWEMI
ncbi:MAG: class I SAM-dependent methyltransferase [Firmicutes bacterium]|nr:class I SAM-dependent methyltransferase [Bacillota bacterium]